MTEKTIQDLRNEKAVLLKQVAELDAKINRRLSQTVVKCSNKECSRGYEIRELVYRQTYWYEEPHGCTGGDTWRMNEGQWECPSCKTIMRLYDKPDIVALKHLFKSVEDIKEHRKY